VPAALSHDIGSRGDGSLTLEFWSNSTDRDQDPVLVGWNTGTRWGVYFQERQEYWSNGIYVALPDANGGAHDIFVTAPYLQNNTGSGQWRHYALTYDKSSGIAKIYVNGIQQVQKNVGSFVPQTSYDLYFGYVQGQSTPLLGRLDEVSVYNRALDGHEIYDIFAAEKNGKCPVDQNQAPAVNAGPDQVVPTQAGSASLVGRVSDDGLPLGAAVSVRWSKMDGPGNVAFAEPTALETTATFTASGIYVLQLTADDSLDRASDTVEVRVGTACSTAGAPGLAAWWPANGSGVDVVSGQAARLLNGANFGKGEVSLGFAFDGANDSVRVPAASSTDIGKAADGSLTIEFWSNSTDRDQDPVLVGWNTGTRWGVYFQERQEYWSNGIYVALPDVNGVAHDIFVTAPYLQNNSGSGQWRHYALTYDKPTGIAKIYVNGVLQIQRNLGSFTPQTSYDLYLGYVQGFSTPLLGMLDEVSVYSRALDGQEIWDIYAADSDGKCPIDENAAPLIETIPIHRHGN
jgi:hypothetical protein